MKKAKSKTRANSLVTTQKIVAGEHLNPNGVLFGGYLMCWMDEIAFMCARRFTGKPSCVTVNIDNITFRNPIKLGEHIHLSAWVNCVGKTSMEIEVKVERESPNSPSRMHTNNAHLTFVCLNKKLRPIEVPRLTLETIEDQKKHNEAVIRAKVRKRLNQFLIKKFSGNWKSSSRELLSNERKSVRDKLSDVALRIGLTSGLSSLSKMHRPFSRALDRMKNTPAV